MTIKLPRWLALAVGGVLALAVIGGGAWYFLVRDTGPSKEQLAAQQHAQAVVKAQAAAAQCHQQLDPLITALKDLEGRLNGAGLTEQDYLTRVGNISSAYGQISFHQLAFPCLTKVGANAEKAMNTFVTAGNTWNKCVTDINCSQSGIDPQLQSNWADASASILLIDQGLTAIGKP